MCQWFFSEKNFSRRFVVAYVIGGYLYEAVTMQLVSPSFLLRTGSREIYV